MNERFKPHTYEGEYEKSREGFEETSERSGAQRLQKHDRLIGIGYLDKKSKFIENILHSINETALENLFKAEIGKSGGNINDSNFLPMSEINIETLTNIYGHYMSSLNKIELNREYFKYTREKHHYIPEERTIPLMQFFKLEVIHTIIHEETHAVGHNSDHEEVIFDSDGTTILDSKFKSGFRRYHDQTTDDSEKYKFHKFGGYRAINEGVTELIAHRILQEYLRQNPPG